MIKNLGKYPIFLLAVLLTFNEVGCAEPCTEVTINYQKSDTDPGAGPKPSWEASMWYIPCGAPEGASHSTFLAPHWQGNSVKVKSGTPITIGQMGIGDSKLLEDLKVSGDSYTVLCRGYINGRGADKAYCKKQ